MDLAYSRMTNIAMMNTVGKSAKERVAIDLDYAYAELDFAVKEQKYKELLDAHLPS